MLSATDDQPFTIVDTLHEKRGKDEIIITTYALPDGDSYTYSIQCRLGRFVRAAYPHNHPATLRKDDVQKAAVSTLRRWTRQSRAAKDRLRQFELTNVGQLEFDFFIPLE